MTAMRAEDQIARPEIGTYSDGNGFFSHIQVNESRKPPIAIQFLNFELKQSQFQHLLVVTQEQILRDLLHQNSFRHY
jgi:hypothetical protein